MPRLPRITARQLIRALKKCGFVEHPERGTSHLVFSHQDGRRTTVARHAGKDIKKGTLAGILRDLKISQDDFRKLL
ncbi:MAG: type II toxin-antitoxin system HicA family toxin [Minisyncoccia bacterium]|jgi:predicted RNA binding protein YcfA (HicA-like mRNA interferase family)